MNFQIGLKLWSINSHYRELAVKLFNEGIFEYIELYAVPDTYQETVSVWKHLNIPFVIHAAHYKHGMCLSRKDKEKSNRRLAEEAFRFADAMKADRIIFHSGINGQTAETARQLKNLNDNRIVIENKPYYGIPDGSGTELICNGSTPEEIEMIKEEAGCRFCLDFGHAVCAANGHHVPVIQYIRSLLELNPVMFHLTDGDVESIYDRHDHYGKGSFPLQEFLLMVPGNGMITNEAVKDSKENLDDFIKDVRILREIEESIGDHESDAR